MRPEAGILRDPAEDALDLPRCLLCGGPLVPFENADQECVDCHTRYTAPGVIAWILRREGSSDE